MLRWLKPPAGNGSADPSWTSRDGEKPEQQSQRDIISRAATPSSTFHTPSTLLSRSPSGPRFPRTSSNRALPAARTRDRDLPGQATQESGAAVRSLSSSVPAEQFSSSRAVRSKSPLAGKSETVKSNFTRLASNGVKTVESMPVAAGRSLAARIGGPKPDAARADLVARARPSSPPNPYSAQAQRSLPKPPSPSKPSAPKVNGVVASRIAVESEYEEVHGGFLQYDTYDGKPAYKKDTSHGGDDFWLFHDSSFKGGPRWYISDSSPGGDGMSISAKSEDSTDSPEKAKWDPDDVHSIRAVGNDDDEKQLNLWHDPEFPHDKTSIGFDVKGELEVAWLPIRTFSDGECELFDGLSPKDILQGMLGDCWLVAAISAMAEFPEEIKNIFLTKEMNQQGKYTIRLYDHEIGDFTNVVIDEYVPCHEKHWWDVHGKPLFSRPSGNEAWVLLVEKAIAKLMGSYGKLDGGSPAIAFRALTGAKIIDNWVKRGSTYKRFLLQDGETKLIAKDDESKKGTDMFKALVQWDSTNCLMTTAIQGKKGVREGKRKDGLIEGHAYTLIQAVELDGHKLLCLRNPWGSAQEWRGAWSDGSPEWTPKLHEQLKEVENVDDSNDSDGIFWMGWLDFLEVWTSITVCHKSMHDSEIGETTPKRADASDPANKKIVQPTTTSKRPMQPKLLNCPGSHGLKKVEPARGAIVCEVCNETVTTRGTWACNRCEWEACRHCINNSPGVVKRDDQDHATEESTQDQASAQSTSLPSKAPTSISSEELKRGTRVDVWIEGKQAWLPTHVIKVDEKSGLYVLSVHPGVPRSLLRVSHRDHNHPLPVGSVIDYFCDEKKEWIDAKVLGWDDEARIYNLDCNKSARAACVLKKRPLGELAIVKCLAGHMLRRNPEIHHKLMTCDVCGDRIQKGHAIYCCRECDYDVCAGCRVKPPDKVSPSAKLRPTGVQAADTRRQQQEAHFDSIRSKSTGTCCTYCGKPTDRLPACSPACTSKEPLTMKEMTSAKKVAGKLVQKAKQHRGRHPAAVP